MTYLSKLVQHCTWANRVWIDKLAASPSADEHLARLMSHILLGERAWFQRIAADEVDRGQMTSYASRAGLGFPNTDFVNFCRVNGV